MKDEPARRRWLPFGVILALDVIVIACADSGLARWLFDWVANHQGSDKAGHFLLIGTLAWALNHALRGRLVSLGFVRVQLGGMIIASVMTIEECSQMWIPGREFDLGDLAANYAGILVAGWLSRRGSRG